MKQIFIIACTSLSMAAFAQKKSFVITGTTYLKDGIAILNDYVKPDTVQIRDGKFEIRGETDKVNMISFQIPPTRSSRIIVEPGNITVKHEKDRYVFGGSPHSIRFQKIEDELEPINQRINQYWSKYNKTEGSERIAIWRLYDQAKKEKMEKTMQLVMADKSFAGFMQALPVIRYESASNIKKYLDAFKFLSNDSRYQSQVKYYQGVAKTDVGVQPPDWNLPDENGKMIRLSSLKGKYVLVDFWYSGCHWCRKMTPGLIRIYNELKDKGLEIVSVSVDPKKDEDKWRKAMEEDGAPWLQAWDMNKTLPDQYSVQGYPTMFFLGPDGKVLQKIFGYHDEPILREFFLSHMNKGLSKN